MSVAAMPEVAAVAVAWRSSLWRRHAWVMCTLAVVGTLGFGAAESWVSVREARLQAGRLQLAQAREVAQAVRTSLHAIDRQVQAVTALPWSLRDQLTLETRRGEYGRLLRLVPSLESVTFIAGGQVLLFVSRRQVDSIGAALEHVAPAARSGYGATAYRDDYDPVLDFEVAYDEPTIAGRTVARIGLRALAADLHAALTPPGAQVYALDRQGTVVLHRDTAILLARQRPQHPPPAAEPPAQRAAGLDGSDVLRSTTDIAEVGWRIVVEQPRDAVMAPVWGTVRRTALFLSLSLVLALAAALYLAGLTSRPIRALHRAVQEVAAGRLDTSIELHTHDELEDLATQFNRMAASLQASVTDLEDRIAARTLDLQRANQHKSEFLANMSHELRTPLNAILGFADVLREGMAGQLSDEQREYIADIHASGLHLLALINDVLDLSKIEAGQLDLERTEFFVPDTVAAALALVRQRCLHKQIALGSTLAPGLGTWVADERRFKQVLLNLLGNAVKFTPAGGAIAVHAGIAADEGLWVEVKDNGVGIAPSDHATVFEEFRQVGHDSAGRAEGTGLGLALVRRLVEQHGGRVTLRSELGAGAVFRFNIPAAAA